MFATTPAVGMPITQNPDDSGYTTPAPAPAPARKQGEGSPGSDGATGASTASGDASGVLTPTAESRAAAAVEGSPIAANLFGLLADVAPPPPAAAVVPADPADPAAAALKKFKTVVLDSFLHPPEPGSTKRKYKYVYFVMDRPDDADTDVVSSSTGAMVLDDGQSGGMPDGRRGRSSQPGVRGRDERGESAAQAVGRSFAERAVTGAEQNLYNKNKENYKSYIDNDTDVNGVKTKDVLDNSYTGSIAINVAEKILLWLGKKGKQSGEKFPALLGLDRNDWENPDATRQGVKAGVNPRSPCWLCGNSVGMGQAGVTIPNTGERVSVCNHRDNQYECEHVLPGVFMLFLKRMVNVSLSGIARDSYNRLYDSSCHIDNTVKDNGLYLKAVWSNPGEGKTGDTTLVFSPNNENIMLDVLTFILSTRLSDTTEIARIGTDETYPRYPGLPDNPDENPARGFTEQQIEAEAEKVIAGTSPLGRTPAAGNEAWPSVLPGGNQLAPPMCSGRNAVHFYSISKKEGVHVISRSTISSIASVALREMAEVVAGLKASITAPPGVQEANADAERDKEARAAERAIAFTRAVRYNNYTRALIEITQIPQIPVIPVASALDYSAFDNLVNDVDYPFQRSMRYVLSRAVLAPPGAAAAAAAVPARPLLGTTGNMERIAALASLKAAGIPLDIDPEKAWAWISNRYISIWNRINEICGILNNPDNNPTIVNYTINLATNPLLTAREVVDLGAIGKIKLKVSSAAAAAAAAAGEQLMAEEAEAAPAAQGGPAKRRRTGGFSFTIRRRSETRQTKKNRRRKVIEVNV